MPSFEKDAIRHLQPAINRLGLFIDTYSQVVPPEPDGATPPQEFLYYAEQSGTVASILGEEYEHPVTGAHTLDLTIRRTRLGDQLTPPEADARSRFNQALTEIARSVSPRIRVEARQINDDDSDNNIQRGLNGLDGNNGPQKRVLFEQRFKQSKKVQPTH